MGTTAVYGLPYSDPEDFVKDEPASLQSLAEVLEDELLAPALVLAADDGAAYDPTHKLIPWDVGAPLLSRGAFTFDNDNTLILPPHPGLYLVTVMHSSDVDAVGSSLQIQSMIASGTPGTDDDVWSYLSSQGAGQMTCAAVVPIDDTADLGIQVEIGGSTSPNALGRVMIHRLSRVAT